MAFTNLSTSLSSAISGLNAAQAAINSTTHNIVNANTEGFVRKTQGQDSRIIAGRGVGVEVGVVERITDEFLIEEVRRQAAITGKSLAIESYYSRTQDAFGNPASGNDIGSRIGALTTAIEAFANDHETLATAQEALSNAAEVARSIGHLAERVQILRSEANRDVAAMVDSINADLKVIDDLNDEIARTFKTGQQNPDLYDKRDLALKRLSEKIEIDTYHQDNGSLAVYTVGGEALVDSTARVLYYSTAGEITPDAYLTPLSIFRPDQIDPATGKPFDPTAGIEMVSGGIRARLTPELLGDAVPDADQQIVSKFGSGRLQGLIEMRDDHFPDLTDQLHELAEGLRFALNAAANDTVAWPLTGSLTGTRTDLTDFAGATRSGTATIAVADANDGSTLLAFQIDLGAVTDETDLVTQLNTNLGAFGSAAINADGALEITLANSDHGLALAEGDSSITITDAAGRDRDYGLSHYFGLNDIYVNDGPFPTDLAVRADLMADPAKLGSAKLDVENPPLVATLGGPGDNRGAKALAVALETNQTMIARGKLPQRNVDIGSYAAEIVAVTATEAHRFEEQVKTDTALADAINFKADSVTSVNLDEELAHLMTLQQAYSVAARVITMVDEMLEQLVNAVR
ncbi:MAG: flagellar basal body rod C-terminal domain-containing protein [Alphaproteobacteria bacterium]